MKIGGMMKLIRHHSDLTDEFRGCVAALGNFDGFHRGHQVVIGEAGRIALEKEAPLAVLTTEPHPRTFFSGDSVPFRLTPFREKVHLFEDYGVDALVVLPFDATLAGTSAQAFVEDILHQQFGFAHLVVGYDYHFGKGRTGDAAALSELGGALDMGVTCIDPISVGVEGAAGEVYSSTLIREVLRLGQARRAAALLGRWWTVNGRIIEGEKRGRTIGFPTANISMHETMVPGHGVYAVRIYFEDQPDIFHRGVANVGTRPTFGHGGVLLEVHVFDFDEDLYDRHARVELVGFIRKERRFDGIDALKKQITDDCQVARNILGDPENAREHLPAPTLESYLERFPEPPYPRA